MLFPPLAHFYAAAAARVDFPYLVSFNLTEKIPAAARALALVGLIFQSNGFGVGKTLRLITLERLETSLGRLLCRLLFFFHYLAFLSISSLFKVIFGRCLTFV